MFDLDKLKTKTILMMGRQGSGKGTQAKLLGEATGFKVFSSGGQYREIAKRDTFVGKKVKSIIDEGMLTPHWFASYLFVNELLSLEENDGIIFEGAGRKEQEIRLFHEVSEWLNRPYVAFYLDLSEEESIVRLQKRAVIENREDDDVEGIRARFKEYEKHTQPSINFLRETGKIVDINGEQGSEKVHANIIEELERLNS